MEEWGNETLSWNGPGQRLGPAKRIYTSKIDGNRGKSEADCSPGNDPGLPNALVFENDIEDNCRFVQRFKIKSVFQYLSHLKMPLFQ